MRAKYYRGFKPQGQDCLVNLQPDKLEIEILGDPKEKIQWRLSQINPDLNPQNDRWIISFGTKDPREYLEFTGENNVMQLRSFYQSEKFACDRTPFYKKWKWAGLLIIGSAFIVFIVAVYLFALPHFVKVMASKVPQDWENSLGSAAIEQLLLVEKPDTVKSYELNQFFGELQFVQGENIKLYFVTSATVNAFAIPGGHIVVYSGIVDKMYHYRQLAGLLAHEYTHVHFKHSLKMIFQSLGSYVFVSFLVGDLIGISTIILDNLNSIRNLSFSRKFETEADDNACKLMIERGIDPKGMLELFEILSDPSGAEKQNIPTFLSTHPLTKDRLQRMEENIKSHSESVNENKRLMEIFGRLKQKD